MSNTQVAETARMLTEEEAKAIAQGTLAYYGTYTVDNVDLIKALSPAVRAARAATASIPIVAVDLESDPVASGFIASNTRPGGKLIIALAAQHKLPAA
jgi:hypothetical protein